MNQKVILALSIIIGVVAFGMSIQYFHKREAELREAKARFSEQTRRIRVVVADRDIPAGLTIGQDDIARDEVYEIETSIRGDVVRAEEAAMVLGRKTLFKIKRGDPVQWSFLQGGNRAGRGLAASVTPGMRALSLSVGGAAAVSSMVRPNDRVDILGTFTFPSQAAAGEMETVTLTVLQDVTVLATGQETANQPADRQRRSSSSGYSTLTVEATPREAELLVFAQQLKGRLTMTLRNASDVSFEKDLPSVNFEKLETSLPDLNLYRQRHIRHKKNL